MERRLAFSWMEGFSPCSTMRHMPLYTRSKSTHACYTWWSVVSPPTAMCKRDTLTTHTGQHQKARKIYDTGNTLHEPGAKKTHMHSMAESTSSGKGVHATMPVASHQEEETTSGDVALVQTALHLCSTPLHCMGPRAPHKVGGGVKVLTPP